MKLNRVLPHAGLCIAFALTPAASAQQQKQQPAKPKATVKKAVQQPAEAPAQAGAVIVKDWESGPGATRAPQPGDFPPTPQLRRALLAAPSAGPTPTSDGGFEIIDPENLQTSLVVTKTTDGSLTYDCKQGGGDHKGHQHAQPQTPRVEVK